MICPKCSFENIPGAKFCSECGSPLTDSGKIAGLAVDPERADGAPVRNDLDTSKIPDIRIPGINAGPDGRPADDVVRPDGESEFDFDPIDDEGEEPEYGDWGPYTFDPDSDGVTKKIQDTRGIDEFLVEPGYVPPTPAWKSGDTMEMPKVEGEESPKKKEFKAPGEPDKKKGGKAKFVVIALVVLLAIGAAAAAITYSMELWGGRTVPDVEGMQKTEAVSSLESLGFTVVAHDEKSDDKEGTVLLMDPQGGSRMEEGTEIVLYVAAARSIPAVVGMTQDEAASAFAAEGLANVEFVTEKSDEAEGTVLSVDPEAGVKALSTSKITVTVAEAFRIPDVAGMSESEALAALSDAGYNGYVAYVYAEDPEGTVIGCDPAAGEAVPSGTDVAVNVAKSRANELIGLANEYLASAGTITIGSTTYEIASVDGSTAYKGGNTTESTVTVRAVTMLDGETVYGSSKQRTVTIVWTDSNDIESIS
ncbi:PASTA domain-containing protein [Raoultibacter phocaeensis]|uniref:PASTA domain-containing protein n=1 Tax=Raoultibacter phocaeensis TaxID=2479841 RepID=UPI001119C205|nr:PASTA domain-containing protein [Raoultibacter phocaeensis]